MLMLPIAVVILKKPGEHPEILSIPPLRGKYLYKNAESPGINFSRIIPREKFFEIIGSLDTSIMAWQEWDTFIRLARIL